MNAFEKLINDIPSMSNEELVEKLDHMGHLEYERAVLDEVKKRLVASDTDKIEKAKRIIKANIKDACCGILIVEMLQAIQWKRSMTKMV